MNWNADENKDAVPAEGGEVPAEGDMPEEDKEDAEAPEATESDEVTH